MRILIVDGDTVSAAAPQRLLARAGHAVRRAATAAGALALCETEQFDLLVCEMDLPDGSGASVARQVAARCGARTIGVSCRDAEFVPDPAEYDTPAPAGPDPDAAAFDARLNKPFGFEDILRCVAAFDR